MQTLTILYTAQLRGDLALLPRLHTYLQHLKTQYEKPLLLDLGDSCANDVWHCAATAGRSTLIILDGMGYHAANSSDFLAEGERAKLQGNLSTGLIDAQHVWRYDVPPVRDEGIIVATQNTPALTLCILATAAESTKLANRTLHLQAVPKGSVGMAQVVLNTVPELTAHDIFPMPDKLKSDPTIAATIDFVEDEARYFQSKQ